MAVSRPRPAAASSPATEQSRSVEAGLGAVVSEVLGQVRGQKHSSHDRHYDDDRRYQKKRKESFLGDLFG